MSEVVGSGLLLFAQPFGDGLERHTHVRAASAIVRLGDAWLIAQDDSNFAAVWRDDAITPLRLFPFVDADTFSSARGNKAAKPDVECAAVVNGRALFLGSGSTPARRRCAVVSSDFRVRVVDLAPLYEMVRQRASLSAQEINLEAACTVGDALRLFQRGNRGKNGWLDVPVAVLEAALAGQAISADQLGDFHPVMLGMIGGVPLGFSGADELPDGRVVFTASAEASPNTYDDGTIAGSAIGLLDRDGALVSLGPVPGTSPAKIEGVAIEAVDGDAVTLLCVTDPDAPDVPSGWLRVRASVPRP